MYFKMPEDGLTDRNVQHILTKQIKLHSGWWQYVCQYLVCISDRHTLA